MKHRVVIALLGVTFLVGGCAQRTASDKDAPTEDSIQTVIPDTVQQTSQVPLRSLPKGAVMEDKVNSLYVYTKLYRAASEDDPAAVKSIWLFDQMSGRVDSLLTTDFNAESRWPDMNGRPVEVPLTQIAAADRVCFVPGHPQLLLVEGCPDARNVWTYIVDLESMTARQFPSTEGLISFSASGDTLVLGAYRYHEEGGRYSVARTFTLAGQLVQEEELDDDI